MIHVVYLYYPYTTHCIDSGAGQRVGGPTQVVQTKGKKSQNVFRGLGAWFPGKHPLLINSCSTNIHIAKSHRKEAVNGSESSIKQLLLLR